MTLNLNYEGFENNLVARFERLGGIQYRFKFENGYGASVVKHSDSYGHERDLWELAVIRCSRISDIYVLCYDTDITNDVIGFLNDEEVRDLLKRISELDAAT